MRVVEDRQLEISLLIIRLATAVFLAVWAFDKVLGPDAALATFTKFYAPLSGQTLIRGLGVAQLVVVALFAAGAFRTFSYGVVLAMHLVSTVASYPMYLDPWARPNILFWAALPVLAAMLALFILRNRDDLLSFDAWRRRKA